MSKATKNPKNISKRGGVYYLRVMVDGKRIFRSLGTADKQLAQQRAKEMIKLARAERFDVLDATKARQAKPAAKLGDVFSRFRRAAATRGKPRSATVRDYIAQLGNVIRKANGQQVYDVDRLPVATLTRDLVERYIHAVLSDADEDDARARRTIRSTLTNARAIFSSWAMEAYEDLDMPDLSAFLAAGNIHVPAKRYTLPPGELIDATMLAGRQLRTQRPELYAVFLLCYDLGLRAGEAAAAQWDWFRQQDGVWCVDVIRRDGFAPKGKERSVPLCDALWSQLQEIRTESDYVLPGENATARYDLIQREFAAWMRAIGWNAERYQHCAHELRALIGSRWYTELGAEVAQTWLGHVSINTTCQFYAALTRHPAPLHPLGLGSV